MKRFIPAVLVGLTTWVATAAEAPSATPPTAGTPAPAVVPIVRLPGTSAAPPPAPPPTLGPGDPNTTVVSEVGVGLTGATLSSSGATTVSAGTSLRQASTSATVQTNRLVTPRGPLPKLAKPERKGVGGFFTSFANLFNPLAPTKEGVGGATEYRYDGQYQRQPLPRGFRDEKTHEPTMELIGVNVEPPVDPNAAKR